MALTLGDKDYLKLGEWKAVCDVCGFVHRNTELRKRWDGFMVCEKDYEARHPQDLIKIPKEKIAPPWTRPLPEIVYVTPAPADPNSL